MIQNILKFLELLKRRQAKFDNGKYILFNNETLLKLQPIIKIVNQFQNFEFSLIFQDRFSLFLILLKILTIKFTPAIIALLLSLLNQFPSNKIILEIFLIFIQRKEANPKEYIKFPEVQIIEEIFSIRNEFDLLSRNNPLLTNYYLEKNYYIGMLNDNHISLFMGEIESNIFIHNFDKL